MKIICIGRNYSEHVLELGNKQTEEPVIFLKPDTAVILKGFPFVIPEFSNDIHYEAEVVVKINRVGKYIDAKFAHKYYEQLTLGIDFTARDVQSDLKSKGLPWEKAKAFDNSAMIGEFVSKSEFESVDNIDFGLDLNQKRVQTGNTQDMIFKIDEIISYVSKFFTLKIGDLIFTGTPAGVGRVSNKDVLDGYLADRKVFTLQVK